MHDRSARNLVYRLQSTGCLERHPNYLPVRNLRACFGMIVQQQLIQEYREVLRDHVALARSQEVDDIRVVFHLWI